jgi:hypothetical protein
MEIIYFLQKNFRWIELSKWGSDVWPIPME